MKRLRGLWGIVLLFAGGPARAEEPLDALYRRAVAEYRQHRVTSAQSLFEQVEARHPHYKKTGRYLARCRLESEENLDFQKEAVAQARELLDVRDTYLTHLRTTFPEVRVQRQDGETGFTVPPAILFSNDGMTLTRTGEDFLKGVKDFGATFQDLTVRVVSLRGRGTRDDDAKRNVRRAILLGAWFFRTTGLPPSNVRILSRRGERDEFLVHLSPLPKTAGSGEEEVQGVMVNGNAPVVQFGDAGPLGIHLCLLDPARVRQWSLKILRSDGGVLVRQFSGTSDVWVSLSWDGLDERGRTVPAGEYQLFLSVLTQTGVALTDSSTVYVKSASRSKSIAGKEPPTPPPSSANENRTWSHVVRFSFNHSDLVGTAALDVKQLAGSLRAFPKEQVVIEGYADEREEGARSLAEERARRTAESLAQDYHIAPERMKIRGRDPRRAVEGEMVLKAVAFFVETP